MVRTRYLLGKGNIPRLRYMAIGVCALAFMGAQSALSMLHARPAQKVSFSKIQGSIQEATYILPRSSEATDGHGNASSAGLQIHKAAFALAKPPQPKDIKLQVSSGDTVAGLLQDAGISSSDAYYSVKALQTYFDPRKAKIGQNISVHMKPDQSGDMVFDRMEYAVDAVHSVVVSRGDDGSFVAKEHEKEVDLSTHAKTTEIETSLYGSAARAGIPAQVIAELIRVYSWSVDFQRDIRRGDKIEVLYDTKQTEDGEFVGYGDISYASISVGGKALPIYRYETKDGRVDYYDPDGRSVRKTLMKTPIDGARLSSGFGMRKHPVLGYNKMHKGLDFAAPTGTPIYAAGDATVEYAGRKGGYGNYVRLRHNGTLKTAYAHLHKFAKGISTGKRVKQGDVIAYVGTTGRSTGPHLHYEVLVNGAQVNPNRVDLPVGEILKAQELERFKALKGATYQEYAALVGDLKMASSHEQSHDNATN